MVGKLGCKCDCGKCCPDGNTWSYTYYPETSGWPLRPYAWPGLSATPSGLDFRSPTPYTSPTGFSFVVQRIESIRLPFNEQDPPIKHGFGQLDLRNLTHQISVPQRSDFERWQPVSLSAFPNTQAVSELSLRLNIGLAVRYRSGQTGNDGRSFGIEFIWTKIHGWRSGRIYYDYKLVVRGWSADGNFSFKSYSKTRTYGPSPSVFSMYFAGDFVSHQLDLKSDLGASSPASYDCTAWKFGAATQEKTDNVLIDPWVYYAQGNYKNFVDKTYCFPYYQFEVTWEATTTSGIQQPLQNSSFANTRVLLKQTDWKYGNRLNL